MQELIDGIESQLSERRATRDQAAADVTRLEGALAALKGPAANGHEKTKFKFMPVLEVYEAAVSCFLPGAVFDQKALREKAITLRPPAEHARVYSGVYNAIPKLIERKRIVRAAGGFSIAPG